MTVKILIQKSLGTLCLLLLFVTIQAREQNTSKKVNLKILGVFSHPGRSHFSVYKPLLEELARRGHHVTVISYVPRNNDSEQLPNYRDISLINSELNVSLNKVDLKQIKHSWLTPILNLYKLRVWAIWSCEEHLKLPQVQEFIRSDAEFDLIITEAFNSNCDLAYAYRFQAPFIALSSHVIMPWANSYVSNFDNPSYIPVLHSGYTTNMNFIERMRNAVALPLAKLHFEVNINWPIQKIVEETFGPDVPPLRDISRKTSAILVNTHFSLHGARPVLPNVVEVGGLHITGNQKLTPELKTFLDNAREGVLLFSWGSIIKANSMPNHTLNEVLSVLGSIPRKVVWKWEDERLINKPSNVLIKKWLPQAAILRHPNVKCYLAHGGLLGITEGVSAGVPMVVVPMYGDQFNNAAAARERGSAIVLEWNNLNAKSLRSAIDRVFNDSSYQRNAKLLQKAWNDRPETPLETAVWWAEYIARGNGNKYLKSAAHSLSWYQIALIDVLIVLAIILSIIVYVFYQIMKFIVRLFVKENKSSVNNVNVHKKKRN